MIAIVGGGISGLATAYELTREGVPFVLFEASGRLGGIVETVRRQGFVIECGPDSWVTEKPEARQLAIELGLEDQLISSNDRWRRTYVQQGKQLVPIPDGMRMMVPGKWGPLLDSPLFSWQARLAYLREPKRAEELKASAPTQDESVADFVRRHFGQEVAGTLAAPLLSAVFGGDIARLSVRAVMPAFVRMEAQEGSLVHAVQRRVRQSTQAIFTSLAAGLETMIDAIVRKLPEESIRLREPVLEIEAGSEGWKVSAASGISRFDAVVLTTPPHVTRAWLPASMSDLLPQEATSSVVVALAFASGQAARLRVPRGFGFVVPSGQGEEHPLLACTFVDQKFPGRVPEGGVLLRAFFGGHSGETLLGETDDALIARARLQLGRVLGPLPHAVETLVRRWPHSLPQYATGHLERMEELEVRRQAIPGLHLVGNAYYGVGVPDLVRQGRTTGLALAKQHHRVAI
jgi:protoporphyrinogen/coproporphyrinogen III oxidase